MTPTTNTSKAREIAETIGCSVQTVMNKAKGLGIKFKGRSVAEHDILLDVLDAVRPRPRKTAPKKNGAKQPVLTDRIAAHLETGKQLIASAAAEIENLDKEIGKLQGKRADLVAYSSLLKAERQALAPRDETE